MPPLFYAPRFDSILNITLWVGCHYGRLDFLAKVADAPVGEADCDGSRAKAWGVAGGMTFTPAILYIAIIVLGGEVVLPRRE